MRRPEFRVWDSTINGTRIVRCVGRGSGPQVPTWMSGPRLNAHLKKQQNQPQRVGNLIFSELWAIAAGFKLGHIWF